MKAGSHLLALALLALGAQLSSASQASQAKAGYCYNVPPLGDIFDQKDCSSSSSACLQNSSCSSCVQDSQCPGTQKCCPGDCGYICQEAVFGDTSESCPASCHPHSFQPNILVTNTCGPCGGSGGSGGSCCECRRHVARVHASHAFISCNVWRIQQVQLLPAWCCIGGRLCAC